MLKSDAVLIVKQGITFAEVRGVMANKYDGAQSKTAPAFTKAEVHFVLSGCINSKRGRVDPKSHFAILAVWVLMEFADEDYK